MAYQISTSANYHWVKKITAATHGDGVLKLTLHGDRDAHSCQFNEVDINVFTDDVEMTDRLIEAINGVSREQASEEMEAA